MKPLRIVLVMLEPPLPFGNAAARWYYVLYRELVDRGHEVRAFAACAKPEEIPKAAALFPAPQYDLKLFPFPVRSGLGAKIETVLKPNSFTFSRELNAEVAAAVRTGCDLVHLEQLWCGWIPLPRSVPKLVNVHFLSQIDLEPHRRSGWKERLQLWLRHRAETSLLRRFSNIVTLSDRLKLAIEALNPAANVAVVPLGLDSGLYDYIPESRRSAEPVIGLIGNMSWYPTKSAAERLLGRLWPVIKRNVPAAKLLIVGWHAKTALAQYAAMPDLTIEENVPETRPYFENTSVLLYAPGRGSGMKVKVLEALGYGVPVVTTSEGIEGLPAIDGVHAGIAEDDAGLIERTVELLNNPTKQNRQRLAGRKLLEEHCGPKPTVDALEVLYQKIVGTKL